ncbi:hypothetical protein JCM11491_002336 [Sporobolomyces phaffii]
MPPRFYTSPYKNALAVPAKREGWWSEVPVSTAAPSDSTNLIQASSEYWLAQGNSSGSLVAHTYENAGKLGGRAPQISTGCRIVQSFELSPFDDLLAVGSDNGQICVLDLPQLTSHSDPTATISPSQRLSLSTSTSKPIDVLSFHPTSSSLLLASAAQSLSIYDIDSHSTTPVFEVDATSPAWSAQWSGDGKLVSATGKDGKLRLWDVRADSNRTVAEILAHAGPKASRHVHLPTASSAGPRILTTGFSRTRDREYSLFDGRMLGNPIKTQRVDTSTGVLMPLVDRERSIVYLVGRGDMSLKWVEVGGPAIFTEGSTPFPSQIAGAALVPPHRLDLMKAEVNRLVVLTNDAVVPVPVTVPRRQYIDFHQDLYPEVSNRGRKELTEYDSFSSKLAPAQSAKDWIQGGDAQIEKYKPDPTKPFKPAQRAPARAMNGAGTSEARDDKPTSPSPPAREPVARTVETKDATATVAATEAKALTPAPRTAEPPTSRVSSLSIDEPKLPPTTDTPSPVRTTASTAVPAPQPPRPSTRDEPATPRQASTSSSTKAPFNPGWSRNFLLGKTPLKPDYYDVHDLSVTMSADVELLKANSQFFFFPLAGPGGRLAVHPVAAKGRLPVHIPGLVSGSTIVNFELDPFDPTKVFVACDDDAVRVFNVPAGGIEGDYSQVATVLKDWRAETSPVGEELHVSDDRGSPKARVWDTESGQLLLTAELPAGGVFSAAWSPDGSRIAFSTKKKQLCVLDPRNPSSIATCPAHESLRPAVVAWASDSSIVTTGFTRSSSRELILYKFDPTHLGLEQVGKQILDVSPALLIPYVDPDTKIVLAYARGERSCFAFEITSGTAAASSSSSSFAKLPSFDHPTLQSGFAFLPKTQNNVREVEVVKSFRLTPGTVEAVSFTVPRMKTDFFQDDVFVPTRNREKPSMTADEWLAGKNTPLEIVDMRPEGMKPLSEAPAPTKIVSTRSKIKDDGLTDSQRETQYMDRLFETSLNPNCRVRQSAQDANGADDDDDDEPQIGRSRVGAPSDDEDW